MSPGTIIVNAAEHKLYFVLGDETAIRYPIAVPKSGKGIDGVDGLPLLRRSSGHALAL